MIDEHRQLWATWDAMGEASDEHIAKVRVDQERRREEARTRAAAEREAARQAQLAEVRREMEVDALAYRAQGPVCGAMNHNGRGTEVSCRLDQGHEADDPTCDAGDGVTWSHFDA